MTNVFDGPPDERQSDDEQMLTSRFRPRYRALSDAEKALHDGLMQEAASLEMLFLMVPESRERSIAITKLEEAIMWAVKGLTA